MRWLRAVVLVACAGCTGRIHLPESRPDGGGGPGADGGTGATDAGPGADAGSADSGTPFSFTPVTVTSAVAKVKNLLLGLPATPAEVQAVTNGGSAALKQLVQGWIQTPSGQGTLSIQTLTPYQAKMLEFFSTAFQQTQVNPTQFMDNDNLFAGNGQTQGLMLANQEQLFAMTALQLAVVNRQPFTDVITTKQFMMTPALMAYYAIVDSKLTDDNGKLTDLVLKADAGFQFSLSSRSGPIPIDVALDAGSPYYFTFYMPNLGANPNPTCAATDPWVYTARNPQMGTSVTNALYSFLFAAPNTVGINAGGDAGYVRCNPPGVAFPGASYIQPSDFSTWSLVTIRPPAAGEGTLQYWDLPTLRSKPSEIVLRRPRVSYFTTPAFFADWQTNASNQARVTINQTMIVGLGHAFDGTNAIAPQSLAALDQAHAPQNSQCFSCHQTLDPMRQYFRQAFSFNYSPQTDAGEVTLPGQFAFYPVSVQGAGLADLATQISQHPLFAPAWVQKLCAYATSAVCDENDPEFQRLVTVFTSSNYDWNTLVAELFSSPLVTYLSPTLTEQTVGETFPVARQAHLCALLSNRLQITDVCGLLPTTALNSNGRTIQTIASVLPSDQFSRGAIDPVLANDPTLFLRAGLENLCLNLAQEVVDNAALDAGYMSANSPAAIQRLASELMGLTPDRISGPLQVLQQHFAACKADGGANDAEALKSTFTLACTSPYVAGMGQ